MAKTHAEMHLTTEARTTMGLKAPSMITFLLSFIIMMAVVFAKFFGAKVPFLNENTEFAGMLIAYILLSLGCLLRSL